ncbi:MAG: 2-succinyl-5-enolpyruvyl-6-hydroxy-3-cyclohexene-1-carboxylic-acid synthase [Myxococcales bacterium]|nr:2-succinyl-5-enolpyruvyl-6-hydroxy-3-cyclohexene-1-carboxylic-acid synthase [Myxococcales bacterium]
MAETLNQRWAATIAGTLVACGVKHVVIAPGSRSTPLALAFADRSELECWSCLDERSAAFFALGLAKGTQTPAAVVCTSGTAGAHFLPALMEAREGATPLIAITADRPDELHGFGAPQTIEQRGLFGGYVRDAASLSEPFEGGLDHVVAIVARLVHRSCAPSRGGVHLNVPFREPLAHPEGLPGPVITPTVPRFVAAHGVPELSDLRQVLAQTSRGLILVGPRERDDDFASAVHALGRSLGFPVIAEAASNARFGFGDAVWSFDAQVRSARFSEQLRPEVVLRFGGGLTLKQPQAWLDASRARIFAFSDDGQQFDPHHRVEAYFSGDVAGMVKALTLAEPRRPGELVELIQSAQGRVRAALERTPADINEPLVAGAVCQALPPESNLVLSSSMPIRDVDAFAVPGPTRLRVFSNRGINGIDGVVSTAAGVSASTKRPTVLLIGDVAALHDLSGWLIAQSSRASLVVVVVNNDGGGIFSFLPVAARTPHFERFFGTPTGVDFSHVAALAKASLHRPQHLAELSRTLQAAIESGGLHLIEVRTERKANVEAHRALNAALVAAVEASS